MSSPSSRCYLQINLSDRIVITQGLIENSTVSDIAKRIGKSSSAVSRELKRNRSFEGGGKESLRRNKCTEYRTCRITNLCAGCTSQRGYCSTCRRELCTALCADFVKETCTRTTRAPWVCTGCTHKRSCYLTRWEYLPSYAEHKARDARVEPRQGIGLVPSELQRVSNLIAPLVTRGQSLAQIYYSHAHEIPCSLRTLYRYVDAGFFSVRRIHLIAAVTYKHRRVKRVRNTSSHAQGRSYLDFCALDQEMQEQAWELDTVIGKPGGVTFLTMIHRQSRFMLIFLLDSNTQEQVARVFNLLEDICGDQFDALFPVFLTDNGSEFKNFELIEQSPDGTARTSLYYCDPYASYQKGRIEKNHEYIRRILKKGTSFEDVTQKDVAILCSHINSVPRDTLEGQSPFEATLPALITLVGTALGLNIIERDEVHLTPSLINR